MAPFFAPSSKAASVRRRLVPRPQGRSSGSPATPRTQGRHMLPIGRRSVVDVAFQGAAVSQPAVASRARILNRLRLTDAVFHHLTRAAAIGVLVLLGGVIVSLIIGSWPAWREFGPAFLIEKSWNPVTEKFGALAPVYGTIITSLIAM